MNRFLIRLVVNFFALYAAVTLLRGYGITLQNNSWISLIWLALIFSLVNVLLKPIITFLTCPLIILTLGLGTLFINTLLFYLAGYIGTQFNVGFTVDGFIPAFLGALIVSVVSFFLSVFLKDENKRR